MNSRGFTLVEIVVAAGVLMVATLALAANLAQNAGLASQPREESTARNAVRSMVATLMSEPFSAVAATYHRQGFDVPGLSPLPGDTDGVGECRLAYGPGGDQSLYTVTVEVNWRGRGGERSVRSVFFLSNVRGDTGTPTPLADLGGPDQIEVPTPVLPTIETEPEDPQETPPPEGY